MKSNFHIRRLVVKWDGRSYRNSFLELIRDCTNCWNVGGTTRVNLVISHVFVGTPRFKMHSNQIIIQRAHFTLWASAFFCIHFFERHANHFEISVAFIHKRIGTRAKKKNPEVLFSYLIHTTIRCKRMENNLKDFQYYCKKLRIMWRYKAQNNE